MARLLIHLEKDDISTYRLGLNIMVKCKENIDLNFTKEAIEELINDYKLFLEKEKNNK